MKNKSLYFLIFTLGILLAVNACTKRPEYIEPSANSLNDYFSDQRRKTQKFTINASKDNVITGSKGTKVSIGGKTLRTLSGQMVTGNVTIELKEITELSEMILNDAPTISNNEILTSGGEFYVAASQNGEQLMLDDNASFFITVAAPGGTTDSMDVFIGVDSSGYIAWAPLNADTVNSNMVVPGNPQQNGIDSAAYYQQQNRLWGILNRLNEYVVRCSSFGWINCDYFANDADICAIKTSADAVFRSNLTKVYFVVPAINSMGSMYMDQDKNFYFNTAPNNTNLKIVALNYHNDKYYICITNHVVNCGSGSNIIDLEFTEIEESQIETYLQQINI